MTDQRAAHSVETTAQIVCAYVGNNSVPADQLSNLIASVDETLLKLQGLRPTTSADPLVPAVPTNKSVSDRHIVCLECGKTFKSLKRHLMTSHALTPDTYRQKWTLPGDYPMVAPAYAKERSKIAKQIGLGSPTG